MIRTSPLIENALLLADHGVDIDTAARRLGTTPRRPGESAGTRRGADHRLHATRQHPLTESRLTMLPTLTATARLVADPDLRFTQQGGRPVANIRLAASDSRKDDRGEWETTEQIFFNLTLWGEEAEKAAEHWRKGDQVYVSGRVYLREYETRDGGKGSAVELKHPAVRHFPRRDDSTPQAATRQGSPSAATSDPWGVPAGDSEPPF